MVYAITSKDEFVSKLAEAGDKAVLVDFHATWCGPCKMIAPFLKTQSEACTNMVVLKVDVDEVEDLAMEHKVEAMPTFIVFKNGKEVERLMGANQQKLGEVFTKYN